MTGPSLAGIRCSPVWLDYFSQGAHGIVLSLPAWTVTIGTGTTKAFYLCAGAWTWVLTFARQPLYQLSQLLAPDIKCASWNFLLLFDGIHHSTFFIMSSFKIGWNLLPVPTPHICGLGACLWWPGKRALPCPFRTLTGYIPTLSSWLCSVMVSSRSSYLLGTMWFTGNNMCSGVWAQLSCDMAPLLKLHEPNFHSPWDRTCRIIEKKNTPLGCK